MATGAASQPLRCSVACWRLLQMCAHSGLQAENKQAAAAFKQMFGGPKSKASTPAAGKSRKAAAGEAAATESKHQQDKQPEEPADLQLPAAEADQVAAAEAAEATTPSDSEAADRQAAAAVQEQKQQQGKPKPARQRLQQKQAASEEDEEQSAESESEAGLEDEENGEADDAEESEQSDKDKTTAAFKAAFKQAGTSGRKKNSKAAAAGSGNNKVEGVGTGALQAAKLAVGVDIKKLVTWKEGQPVPYAFLADTFQVSRQFANAFFILAHCAFADLLGHHHECMELSVHDKAVQP